MRLLLVTYEYPPKSGPGVLRPAKTARYLAEAGHDVVVLTVADPPAAASDPELAAEIPESVDVRRAWSLEPTRLVRWLRGLRRREAAPAPAAPGAPGARGYSGLPPWAVRLAQAFFLPDEKVGWTPFAVRAGVRANAEGTRQFDAILASGPPFTAMRVAWKLARKLRVPWVADLRDPIVNNYFFRPPTPLHAWYRRRFERKVARDSSAVIVVSEPMRETLIARYGLAPRRVVTIPNGFDPTDFAGLEPRAHDGFRVAYVGTFQGSIQPNAFLDAVALASRDSEDFARDVRIRFVGGPGPLAEDAVAAAGLAGSAAVELAGVVPHREAVREMLEADVLLLVLGPERASRAILTGKLPEYVGARKPILGMVPEGAAAEVLAESGAAQVVPPDDVDGAARALLGMYEAWRVGEAPAPAEEVVRSFDRKELVARTAEVLERVVASARARGARDD